MIQLKNFCKVLEKYQDEISAATYWRYRVGKLPKPLQFIFDRPDLAMALAKDSKAAQKAEA